MATRDQAGENFGPRLMEAIMLWTLDEINELRTPARPAITEQEMIDRVEAKHAGLSAYDWETDGDT